MNLSQKQFIIVASAGVVLAAIMVLVFLNLRTRNVTEEFEFSVWGTESDQLFSNIIQGYQQVSPGIKVSYKQIDAENYESVVLNALASGEGPDVFYISNRELPKVKNRLVPVDPVQFNLIRLREIFPSVVESDFTGVPGGQIYALPLYLDTLALIYNRDIFDQAGVVSPPATWDEFQDIVPKLRQVNPNGQIVRAAAAIGGSEISVDSAADLVQLLMLQNGTRMTDDGLTTAAFSSSYSDAGGIGARSPGLAAFNFYLQFANAGSPYYTWNDGQSNSLDAFANGKVAVIFNYQSALAEIERKSPFLSIGIAPVPQAKGSEVSVSFPKYHGLAVSRQSGAPRAAWDFIIYITTRPEVQEVYLNGTGHPPATRTFIGQALNKPGFNVFAEQALTARSWYVADDVKIEEIFDRAIQSVLSGQADSAQALRQAQDQVSQLMR